MNDVVKQYHHWAYESKLWTQVRWKGVACEKFPGDLWVLQEIIWETKPEWIIEVGVMVGGTTCFLADLLGHPDHVIAVDIRERPASLTAQRYVRGDSVSEPVLAEVRAALGAGPCMVILDSDHRCAHVRRELDLYSPMVTPGQYLIVEDTDLNGHPILPGWGPGPYEAVEDFLLSHPEFEPDRGREKFGVTMNPGGYLRRLTP